MKLLGNRILVSRIEEPKTDGFQTVEVQDSFVNKGRVEQIGGQSATTTVTSTRGNDLPIFVGDTVLFAKYSPDTQDIEHEGVKYKVINMEDVIAVL